MAAFVVGPLLCGLLLAAAGVGTAASPRRVTPSPVGGYSEESK
jgi:hypothetical protein